MPHFSRFVLSLSALTLLSLPALAADPPRRHATPAPYKVKITGVVIDATTNNPVASVDVAIVNSKTKGATNAEGKFSVNALGGYSIGVEASRSGYTSQTKTITATGDTVVNFTLTPTPTATIREVNGTTTAVDVESLKLAYLVPFSGYVSDTAANFCLADGTVTHPNVTELAKLIGPATPQNVSSCCRFPIMSMQAVFKNGQRQTVYFADSCFGNEVDVLGREHNSGQFVYFNLTNVAEVTLP